MVVAAEKALAETGRILPWLVSAFCIGAFIAFAIVMLAFRLYVDIAHPYLFVTAGIGMFALFTWLFRNRGPVKPSLMSQALTIIGQTLFFLAGAAGTFSFLMSVYPPNFT